MPTRERETPHDTPRPIEERYRRLYAAEAARYDDVRFNHPRGQSFHARELATVCELLDPRPGQTVLDVAAGTGRIAGALAARGVRVTAVDLTPEMLRRAGTRAGADSISAPMPAVANGRQLPFPDGRFDGVIAIRFLHLFPVRFHRAFVLEMWRVLKPGGVLLIEFDSALSAGGVLAWGRELYRRRLRGHKPRYYLWPHQLPRVFAGIRPLSLRGFSIGGARLVESIAPRAVACLEGAVLRGGLGFLANRLFVRALKPA